MIDNAHAPLGYSRKISLVLNFFLRARVRFRPAEAARPNRLASLERNAAEMNCTLVRFSKKFTIMSLLGMTSFERSARLPKTSIVTQLLNATNRGKLFAYKKKTLTRS